MKSFFLARLSAVIFSIVCFSFSSVQAQPAEPTVSGERFVCSGNTVTLTASGETGASFAWYDARTGGTLLGSTAAYTSGTLTSNTHFYVQQTTGSGTSSRTDVYVVVTANPSFSIPTSVTATPSLLCSGGTARLTAKVDSTSGQQVYWYDAATGGNLLAVRDSGADYIVSPSVATTYYAQSEIGTNTITFEKTGSLQTWTVPAGVTSIKVDAYGAGAWGYGYGSNTYGGKGGRVQATLSVTPGEVLNIYVGGESVRPPHNSYDRTSRGGYNGGGNGEHSGGGGGGATDIRLAGTALTDRVLVAGGGGGGGTYRGGKGGGLVAGDGKGWTDYRSQVTHPGKGGTQSAGGAHGYWSSVHAQDGSWGKGGKGKWSTLASGYGSGGGGGYYGGGGSTNEAGAGGGSSYTNASLSSNVVHTQGVRTGNGQLSISYLIGAECASTTTRKAVTVSVDQTPTVSAGSNMKSCPGNTVSLTATGAGSGGSYTWMPGTLSGGTISVSPSTTTTYAVTGTTAAGCPHTANVTVYAENVATNGNKIICSGQSVTLKGSNADSYSWSPGGGTSANITVSPTVLTTYTVTGTNTAGSGCSTTTTATVTVNPLPTMAASATNTSIYNGDSVTISYTGNANTLVWAPVPSTQQSITFAPSVTATYTVVGKLTATGCQASDNVTVTVLGVASISGITTICKGNNTTLTASGATAYKWYDASSGGTMLASTAVFTTSNLSTNTTFWVSGDGGRRIQVNVHVVDVILTNVLAGNNNICIYDSTELSAKVGAGKKILWYTTASGGTAFDSSADATSVVVSPATSTTYYAEGVARIDTITFEKTGSLQTWTVPAGVTSIKVDAYGAGAWGYGYGSNTYGGKGGRVQATLSVTPGEVLNIYVGGESVRPPHNSYDRTSRGGYNGGGNGEHSGGGGGGATDIRLAGTALTDRVLVAGGGGGGGTYRGGKGGGLVAGDGKGWTDYRSQVTHPGKGGTQSAGGAHGYWSSVHAQDGSWGKGGKGKWSTLASGYGSGGGGGYYGGGGSTNEAGAGGGSSYTNASLSSNVVHTQGVRTGNGQLRIVYSTECGPTTRIPVAVSVLSTSSSTLNPTACASYTSPSGKTWTSSGTSYMDTIPNVVGCDSVLTINLTIKERTYASFDTLTCDSFISPSGKIWMTTGTYMDTITNDANCDSVLTYNVTLEKTADIVLTVALDSNVSCFGLSNGGATASATLLGSTGGIDTIIYQSFQSASASTYTSGTSSIGGLSGWSYSESGPGRLKTTSGKYHSGNRSIVLESSSYGTYATNYVVYTKDLSSYASNTGLGFSFWFRDYNVGNHSPNRVWIRGSSASSWIEVYNWASSTSSAWRFKSIDVATTLASNSQTASATFQIRFGARLNDYVNWKYFALDDVTIFADKPSANFTYAWSNSAATASITGVIADKYLVSATSEGGCVKTDSITITQPALSVGSETVNTCDSFLSPSGKVWTTSNTYKDTIPNSIGCDSIITFSVTIQYKSFETISADVCDSFLSPSGKIWTTSNTYLDTIPNDANCDSIITVNLTVRYKSFATISDDVCDSYTSPSGKTWTTTNTYLDTIPNDANCDSIITVNLIVRYKSFFSFAETVYETFTSPSGKTWTNSGTYLDTIPNDVNCDSIITIELTVINKLFVDTDGGSGSGKSWGTSMKTLDDAIKAANATDNHAEIWMRKGMYYPGGQSSNNRDSAFVVTNPNFELLGGFAGTETQPGQRNQTANPTILCGDIGKTNDSSDNVYHVLIIAPNGSDIGPNFKLDGLTFRNGNADGSTKYTYGSRDVYQTDGGAITIMGSGTTGQEISPTITNCHFEGNYGDYGSIYIRVPSGKSFATISHCTFKNNHSIYGAIFNNGQGGEVSPNIVNCAFDGNTSATSGAAIYNYGYGGKASPTITSCVFNNNSASSMGGAIYNTGYGGTSNPVITNSTFHANAAGSHAGAMYNFGNSGTCQPKVTNAIFYKNSTGGDVDHKFSEFYNYAAYPYVKNSSMQRASSTYTTGTANSLNGGTNNIFQTNPNFEAIADGNGADDVWRTGDDGLRLSSSSTGLLNGGVNSRIAATDILGNQRMGTTDMGAYEYVNCGLNVKLATAVKTHTATQSVVDGGFVCYCNSDNELLLALDTNGTGAVVTPSQVQLYIGNPSTLSYNSAGGMITNTAGGVILERRWDVDPTTQPTSPVTVRYFYTNDDYSDIVTAMAGLTAPTTISSPSQLQFYKVTGGSTATFPNPHDTGVTGIVLTNGTTASTTVWVNGTHGVQDHTAEYLVSTFSGGGGGGGGGSEPLPVELIQFEANASASHSADLTWKTASELNNSHFVVERSYDGRDFEAAAIVQGNGTTQNVMTYNHNDNTIELTQNTVYYRLRQVDFDGTEAYSPIRRVDFDSDIIPSKVSLYPNPTKGTVTVSFSDDQEVNHKVKVIDNLGRVLYQNSFEGQAIELDLSSQATGIYFIILDSGESFKVIKD